MVIKKNKKSNLLTKRLFNSMPLPSHINGMRLLNAGGDIDPSGAGFQYLITTMSYVREKVVNQVFYEIPIADYMPVDVGSAAWAEEIVQNVVFQSGGDFYDGDVDMQTETGRLAQVDAGIDKLVMPIKSWGKGTAWTIFEIYKAALANNWDVVESKLGSLKKNWDLGVQETAFLGHPNGKITGLLNDPEATINTTLITKPLTAMTETEFTAFIGGLLPAYFANGNDTVLPDTFVIPNSDFLGLGVPYSESFPNISKLQYMLDMFRSTTGNANFAIKGLSYSQADKNVSRGINKNRYSLYRNVEDTGKMSIPVDFTMLEADTANKLNWTQAAIGQYSGYLLNRKREMLYIDETAT